MSSFSFKKDQIDVHVVIFLHQISQLGHKGILEEADSKKGDQYTYV